MNIAFFISDHGFGHIMRNVSVMSDIIKKGHNVILICGQKHIDAVRSYFESSKITYIPYHTDAGILVKPGTILLDKSATAFEVETYISEFPERINFAHQIIAKFNVHRLVADIVPWSLIAAKECGIPSYLMASFTWVEQYQGFIKPEYLEIFKNAFKSATNILYYDLVNQSVRDLLGSGIEVGLTAREFTNQISEIKSQFNKPSVFLALGVSNSGLDFEIDVSALPYHFITTKAFQLIGNNVTYLDPKTPNTQDYIKAADFCITKSGWSTVAETLLAGKKFAVLRRNDVTEDTLIIEQLEQRQAAISVDVIELKNLGMVLDKMQKYDYKIANYKNNYAMISDVITFA